METERLLLRSFWPEDWKDLYEYLSDPEVVRYEPYDVLSASECRAEARRRARANDFWAVCLRESTASGLPLEGKMIGNLYLHPLTRETAERPHTWELGYVFSRAYQRQGYATESVAKLLQYAFEGHQAHRVVARCNPLNHRSWMLLERLGFRREGHFIKNVFFRTDDAGQPLWQDTFEYGLLSSEWRARHANPPL